MTILHKYRHWAVALVAMAGLALGALGCADKITGPGPSGKVSVNLELKAGPAVSFRLTVTAADMDTIIVPMGPTATELATVVEVPLGTDRHFLVEGLDLTGVVLYRGESVHDVLAIQPLDLTIEMPPVAPMIYLIPHISTLSIGNQFVITMCVNNLQGLTGAGIGFSLDPSNFGKNGDKLFDAAVIDSVVLDPDLEGLGVFFRGAQEGPTEAFIQISTEGTVIVDEEGDACLVNIHCSTQDTWLNEPLDLIPAMFIENLNGIELTLGDVHLDTARFRLVRERAVESFLGTEGEDTGVALAPVGGGEFMLAGSTSIFDPTNQSQESSLYLARLDRALQPRFERFLPWTASLSTRGMDRGTGGLYAVGDNGGAGSEVVLVDDDANEVWRVNLGISRHLLDVAARPSGGCIVSGMWPNDGFHFFLAAFDINGAFIPFEPTDFSSDDFYQAVVALDDTTFVAAGIRRSFSANDWDLALGKYTLGRGFTTVWERLTASTGDRIGTDMLVTDDGRFLVVGRANTGAGVPNDVLAIMHDADGFPIWERTFDALGEDVGVAVTESGDGGYVIAGSTSLFAEGPRDVVVIKVSDGGDLIWQRVHGGPTDESARDIVRDGSGFLVTGASNAGPHGGLDNLLLRLDGEGR